MSLHPQRKNPVDSHPYPDVFSPAAGYPLYAGSPLLSPGSLKDRHKQDINWSDLKGKSVALFFADPDHCKTCSFMPMLLQFYRTMNENGDRQKIEVIFVPTKELLQDADKYERFVCRMPWLHYDACGESLERMNDHYRVLANINRACKFGYPALTESPGMVVIDESGATLQKLHVDDLGHPALLKWDYYRDTF